MGVIKKIIFIEQMEKNECGFACLAMLMDYYGYSIPLSKLREKYGTVKRGISFKNMLDVCSEYGMEANAYRIKADELSNLNTPCIIQWNHGTHFVVLEKMGKFFVQIVDPAVGELKVPVKEFQSVFEGNILRIESVHEVKKRQNRSVMLHKFLDIVKSNIPLFFFITIFSVAILAVSLIPTYILGRLVDQLLDHNAFSTKLLTIAITMPILLFVLQFLKEQAVVAIANRVDLKLMSDYFIHFLKVPLSFLENRQKGDLINRFNMLGQIRDFFTVQVVTLILNVLMIVVYSVVLFTYSLHLGLSLIMWICIVTLLLSLLVNESYNLSKKILLSQIKIQNLFTESINLMQDIKIYSLEKSMYQKWERVFDRFLMIRTSNGRLKGGISSLLSALQIFQSFLVFFIGSVYVVNDAMSFGSLFYIIMIANMIAEPVFSSCSIYMDFVRTSTMFQRIDDIESTESESGISMDREIHYGMKGRIEFKNVSFRYSQFEPLILDHVSFVIEPGESVFLQGMSGAGKSTIMKLILGIYKATEGTILIDDVPMEQYDIRALRRTVSAVQQDGMLFNTTILDNIVLNEQFERSKFERIIQEANLEDVLDLLPHREDTAVAENGRDFSQGQRQRILLARALYKESKVLILDEATNFLHKESEAAILQHIFSQKGTKLVISHNIDARNFDKVLRLERGQVSMLQDTQNGFHSF